MQGFGIGWLEAVCLVFRLFWTCLSHFTSG